MSWVLALAVAMMLGGCDFLRGYADGGSAAYAEYSRGNGSAIEDGAAQFVFGDFGGLSTDTLRTNAVPWKVVATALVTTRWPADVPTRERLAEVLAEFGFITPRRIANWPGPQPPEFVVPVGLVTGRLVRTVPAIELEVANLGCAACHAGVTYDEGGRPTADVWLGLPNTSIDLDSYVAAILRSLQVATRDREALLQALVQLFPETSNQELKTIRRFVWPSLVERMATDYLPFDNGGPGRSNGVGALRLQLRLPPDADAGQSGVSIPALGDLALRQSLLVDGIYRHRKSTGSAGQAQLADVVAFFTVPTMGLKPDRAAAAIPAVSRAMTFLASYQPPVFPAAIDGALARRGARLYALHCARCHGDYAETAGGTQLTVLPDSRGYDRLIATDGTRAAAINADLVAAIRGTTMSRYIDVVATGRYVAPPLSGIWATAPYLHNGSVPTLWHLMRPRTRPPRFWSGGHALDLRRVGIAGEVDDDGTLRYAPDYVPWATPRLYDTRLPGQSSRGHEQEFDSLTEPEKDALLEFLKRL